MNEPTFTIRVNPKDIYKNTPSVFIPIPDIQLECDKFGVKMEVVEEKYFDFTTDDVKNFFFLGLNFPKV